MDQGPEQERGQEVWVRLEPGVRGRGVRGAGEEVGGQSQQPWGHL